MRRLTNYPAIIVTAVLAAANAIGLDISDPEALRTTIVEGVALLMGGAFIHQTVYGPRTADEIMDAHTVISAVERGER